MRDLWDEYWDNGFNTAKILAEKVMYKLAAPTEYTAKYFIEELNKEIEAYKSKLNEYKRG